MNFPSQYTINYKSNTFEKVESTPVHDKPTKSTLLTFCSKIKANTQSIYTILVRGNNGHLILVLTPINYVLIPSTAPYLRPPLPILNIPFGGIINSKNIKGICNTNENNITLTISKIFNSLFRHYDNVAPEELYDLCTQVEAYTMIQADMLTPSFPRQKT
eukprot:90606-Ditylum_brightwellii.AAC.1